MHFLSNRFEKSSPIIDLSLFTIGYVLFYSLWLGSYFFFTPDEGRYIEIAREMVASGDFITPKLNSLPFLDKPILYYWLQALAIKIFGVHEWALRLMPVLMGLGICVITYLCSSILFQRKVALLAAIILSTSPLFFISAHYANLDLTVAALISATLLTFITGVKDNYNQKYFMASYICAGLAFLTKGLMGIVFPALIIGSWILLFNQWKILPKIKLPLGLLLFVLLVAPWYVLVQLHNPKFFDYFFVTQQVNRFLSDGTFNNQSSWWLYIPVILCGMFPWSIFLIAACIEPLKTLGKTYRIASTEGYLLLWLAIILIFFSIPHSKILTYILPIFPAAAILIANYIIQHSSSRPRLFYWTFFIGNCVLISLLVAAITHPILDMNRYFENHIALLGVIIASTSIAILYLRNKTSLIPLIVLGIAMNMLGLLTITSGAHYLTMNSAKPLTTMLETQLKPQDIVINYYKYYYDVPLYLHRFVYVVADWNSSTIRHKDNWIRELSFGKDFYPYTTLLIDDTQFRKLWFGSSQVYVFLNDNYLAQLESSIGNYNLIGQYNDINLVTNKNIAN